MTHIKKLNTIVFVLLSFVASAQQPTHVPSPQNNTPVAFDNLFDIIVFIVMPILIVVFYFLWRRQVRRDREKEEKNKNNKA